MSHTNSTTHYSLPQFVGTDTPGWLTDVNSAMSSIDAAIYARQQETVSNSDAITANTADINGLKTRMTTAEGSLSTLEDTATTQGTQITNLQTAVTTNTSDIASLATRVTNLDAADIAYDNTTSGLTATTTQAAVDELAARSPAWVELVQNTTLTGTVTIQMTDSANNYDAIMIYTSVTDGDGPKWKSRMMIKPMYDTRNDVSWEATDSTTWYVNLEVRLTGDTLNNISVTRFQNRNYMSVGIRVFGIKF